MWRYKIELELIFNDEQMEIILESYMKQDGFSGTVEEFIKTLAQVGVCTTLIEMAENV